MTSFFHSSLRERRKPLVAMSLLGYVFEKVRDDPFWQIGTMYTVMSVLIGVMYALGLTHPYMVWDMVCDSIVQSIQNSNAQADGDAGDSRGNSTLSVGRSVKIHGLRSERGRALNGKYGTIATELDGETGRHGVRLKGGRIMAVKPGNLTLVAARPVSGEGRDHGPGPARSRDTVEAARVKICGACERELPKDSFSEEQGRLRQSMRRCKDCLAGGTELVLMKTGRTRSEEDECPICNLPLPFDDGEVMLKVCCMKKLCNGCIFAARKQGMRNCPFCRAPVPDEESKTLPIIQKRVDAGDPIAFYALADAYRYGLHGAAKNIAKAVKYYKRAAELGEKDAHYNLGVLYEEGVGVKKDAAKAIQHWEAAAMCGHVSARYNLGCVEKDYGSWDLALQHWKISATLGDKGSMEIVRSMFMGGQWSAATNSLESILKSLSEYQSAVKEMSSPDRHKAKALGLDAIRWM